MEELEIIGKEHIRPRFRLDLKKYAIMLSNSPPRTIKSKPIQPNRTFHFSLSDAPDTSPKIENTLTKAGNMHFHDETLRYDNGLFSMNRIFATPGKKTKIETEKVITGKKRKVRNFPKPMNMKDLIIKTNIALLSLKRPRTGVVSRRNQSFDSNNALRVKSKEYFTLLNNE